MLLDVSQAVRVHRFSRPFNSDQVIPSTSGHTFRSSQRKLSGRGGRSRYSGWPTRSKIGSPVPAAPTVKKRYSLRLRGSSRIPFAVICRSKANWKGALLADVSRVTTQIDHLKETWACCGGGGQPPPTSHQ